jgi:hypothetical protein
MIDLPLKNNIHNVKMQANEIALLQDSMFTKDVFYKKPIKV